MDREWDEKVSKIEYAKQMNQIRKEEEEQRDLRRAKKQKRKENRLKAKERQKFAHLSAHLPQDGTFMEVFERKERLKKMMEAMLTEEEDNDNDIDEDDDESDDDVEKTQDVIVHKTQVTKATDPCDIENPQKDTKNQGEETNASAQLSKQQDEQTRKDISS